MSKVNWTEQQTDAIEIRNTDTLVSAAAGSGKTAVLVERVIRMITDIENPIDIDKILVVTFTNAAAKQMKEKISAAISKEIEEHPENMHLKNQLMLLGGADIRTYDSFCQNLIKENFQKTDLPFDFEIIQKTEAKILKAEALDETFNEFYEDEEKAAAFTNFADSFSGKDDKSAEEFIYGLYDFIRTMPHYTEWIKNCSESAEFDNPDDTVWGQYLKEYSLKMLKISSVLINRAIDLIKENGELYGISKYFDLFYDDKNITELFIASIEKGYFEAVDFAQNKLAFSKLPTVRGGDDNAKAFLKGIREYSKKITTSLMENIYYLSEYDVKVMSRGNSDIIKIVSEVIEVFDKKFSKKKIAASLVDFADISHKCVDLLTKYENGQYSPSDIALRLRDRYAEVLVDEYQDTNNLQEHILNMISGKGKKFMVGDIKQCIYKFRNSKPELFLEKYNSFSEKAGEEERKLILSKNFRSYQNILDYVNFTFEKLMCRECGGLDYSESEKLNFSGIYPESDTPVEIAVFDNNYTCDDEDKASLEAKFCAQRIRAMVDEGYLVADGDSPRPCTYGDFTILLRKKKNMELFKNSLSELSIPSYVEISDDYINHSVIRLVVSLFKIIDNPRQDIDLAAVLRSDLFGFTDDELVDIRLIDKGADFYTCLTRYESDKARNFFEKLNRWRELSEIVSVYELVNIVFDEMFMYTLYAEDAKILRAFADWAKKYSQSSFKGLFRFITYLQKQLEENEDMGTTNINSGDAVTIMTIHSSKGLENHVVILAETAGEFKLIDSKSRFAYHDELGIAADYVDTDNRIKYKTLQKIAIEQKIADDGIAEEMRLLYVALTRAKQRLLITASYQRGGLDKKINKCISASAGINETGFSVGASFGANSYIDWILSSLAFYPGKLSDSFLMSEFIPKSDTFCRIKFDINPPLDYSGCDSDFTKTSLKQTQFIPNADAILGYEYPYSDAAKVPSKLSVSEIKTKYYSESIGDEVVYFPRKIDNSLNLIPTPQFMKETESLTPALLGTAYHSVLQYLDFGSVNCDNIEEVLDSFVEKSVITESERKAVDVSVIKKFIKSDLFGSIKDADKVYKEYSFVLPFDSSAFFENTQEEIMVQGIIDCLYIKDENIYLVDYKSDSYASSADIADRYRTQIMMYSEAIEKKFGKKPISSVLYMLKTGEIISL